MSRTLKLTLFEQENSASRNIVEVMLNFNELDNLHKTTSADPIAMVISEMNDKLNQILPKSAHEDLPEFIKPK